MDKILKISTIILIFITVESFSQQYWLNLGKATTQNLLKCSFVDTSYGWAVGDSGTIIHTSNGGTNWIAQNSKLHEYMISVFFLNRRLGWALSWGLDVNYFGTYILKTTNGGISWDTARYPIPDTYIRTIYFMDSLIGYMGGGPSILLKTTNAGVNWFDCKVDTSVFISRFPISRFRFYNSNYGVAMGGVMDIAGVFWKTTNAGLYWSAKAIAPEPIMDIHFFDTSNILAIGGDYEYGASILRSYDGGLNWTYDNLQLFGIPQAISFRTDLEAWIPMGYTQAFLMTNDSGSKWNPIDTPDSTQIFDLVFKSNKFGIGVGLEGTVIKFNYASVNINNTTSTIPYKYSLKQNYPNPFNPNTKIEYNISDISEIDLKVFNLLGQEIKTIFKGIKTAGSYTINFSGNNLPSGMYFYRLSTKNLKTNITNFETKKMILLK
jgi:photosystem II stability/assembly factor-like uncharacterized protein